MANKKEHTIDDTIAEVKAVREARSEGSWRLIQVRHRGIEVSFVRYSEADQYNLLTPSEYKTQQKADLALALITRPSKLTYTEHQQLLALLEE